MDDVANVANVATKMVVLQKRRSMEALDKLRTNISEVASPKPVKKMSCGSPRPPSRISGGGSPRPPSRGGIAAVMVGSGLAMGGSGMRSCSLNESEDSELVDTAAKFVQEVLDKAKIEASKRMEVLPSTVNMLILS